MEDKKFDQRFVIGTLSAFISCALFYWLGPKVFEHFNIMPDPAIALKIYNLDPRLIAPEPGERATFIFGILFFPASTSSNKFFPILG